MVHIRVRDHESPARSKHRLLTGAAVASIVIAISGCSGGAPSEAPPPAAPSPAQSTPQAGANGSAPATTPGTGKGGSSAAPAGPSNSKAPTPVSTSKAAPSPSAAAGSATTGPSVKESTNPEAAPVLDSKAKAYIKEKVAKGGDPDAVIQVGQEVCDRLATAKKSDPDAVVSELVMDPKGEAADAINSLCEGLKPELARALKGFPDGKFNVGESAAQAKTLTVAPGKYVLWNQTDSCMLEVYSPKGDILATYSGEASATIPANAGYVVSSGCYSWLPAK